VKKLGKAIVIVFAAISFLLVPISLFYVADTATDTFILDFQGRFYDIKMGDEKGFGFFKFVPGGSNFFSPSAWNTAFPNTTIFGMQVGTILMILWYVGIAALLIGIIVAFFKTKLSGLFFVLAFLIDGLQSIVWYLGMKGDATNPYDLYFPIPVSVLFLLITFILAFTSKKKESYYYSPGYSYGYGRR